MYHTTGFMRDEIVELCARVHAVNKAAAEFEKIAWPPLGLFMSVGHCCVGGNRRNFPLSAPIRWRGQVL